MTDEKALVQAARQRVPDFDARYDAGELEVLPGQRDNAPVVRDSTTKRLVKGSGRHPKANDPAEVSRQSAHKRTRTHRKAIEAMISVDGDDPEAVSSLRDLLQTLIDAVTGGTEVLECRECKSKAVYRRKVDTNALFKVIEMVGGKAPQTVLQGIEENTLEELMSGRRRATEAFTLTPGEAEERKRRALEEGIVEGEWFEEEID